jgi:hypothetical protein
MKNTLIATLVSTLLSIGLSNNVYAGNDSGDERFYIEIGGSYSVPSDISARFISTNDVNWDTGGGFGEKIQLGWDFGNFRSDIKVTTHSGGIDSINGIAVTRDDFWYGSLTLNGYWDIFDKKVGKRLTITPYVGGGLGGVGGFIRAQLVDGTGATLRENQTNGGLAGRAMLGAQLQISKNAGFTLGYDFLAGNVGDDILTNHAFELGLRITF